MSCWYYTYSVVLSSKWYLQKSYGIIMESLLVKSLTVCEKKLHQMKLRHRNKLIRIADKSVGAWDTVKEYESDDQPSDSKDERKCKKAESRAISKRKLKQPNKPVLFALLLCRYTINPASPLRRGNFRSFRPDVSVIQCFACGGWGHTRPDVRLQPWWPYYK